MESTAECWRQLKKRENIRKDIDSKGKILNLSSVLYSFLILYNFLLYL